MPAQHPLKPLSLASAHLKLSRPVSLSPVSSSSTSNNMSPTHRNSDPDDANAARKRVGKACDRCRMKKSKCDGATPCNRCKTDNQVCKFGERKKSQDKVYPKGYVEMLEEQQKELVAGLQRMYKTAVEADAWTGETLEETNGQPLTHDILASLNVLKPGSDFEEDTQKIQDKLVTDGAGYYTHQRPASVSSESDHSPHIHSRNLSNTPAFDSTGPFRQSFDWQMSESSPVMPSAKKQRRSFQTSSHPTSNNQSPNLGNSPLGRNDSQMFQTQPSALLERRMNSQASLSLSSQMMQPSPDQFFQLQLSQQQHQVQQQQQQIQFQQQQLAQQHQEHPGLLPDDYQTNDWQTVFARRNVFENQLPPTFDPTTMDMSGNEFASPEVFAFDQFMTDGGTYPNSQSVMA